MEDDFGEGNCCTAKFSRIENQIPLITNLTFFFLPECHVEVIDFRSAIIYHSTRWTWRWDHITWDLDHWRGFTKKKCPKSTLRAHFLLFHINIWAFLLLIYFLIFCNAHLEMIRGYCSIVWKNDDIPELKVRCDVLTGISMSSRRSLVWLLC